MPAIDTRPPAAADRVRLALRQLEAGDFSAALATARDTAHTGLDLKALSDLGRVFAACDEHDAALQAFADAQALAPGDPQADFNLATALRNVGDFAGAEARYDAVIRARRTDWEAYSNRSDLRTQTEARNHLAELTAAVALAGGDLHALALLHRALGKEYEDLDRSREAFAHYRLAADSRRRTIRYDVAQDLNRMREIAALDAATPQRPGFDSAEPIFIVGLPRTGSTLVERILSAHPAVFAAGELQNFGVATFRLAQQIGGRLGTIAAAHQVDPALLGRTYVESTRPRTGGTPYFIDKMPTNFLYLGLILRALPNAKVIHLARDPVDACFAIYKTQFKQAYPYSYDLEELAIYYDGYRSLMDHWRTAAPDRVIDVAYEEVVADPETEIRHLLDALGLPFDPACLRFFESAAPASTASAAQVRRPVYTSSVGRWRRHADDLAPLTDELRRRGVIA